MATAVERIDQVDFGGTACPSEMTVSEVMIKKFKNYKTWKKHVKPKISGDIQAI